MRLERVGIGTEEDESDVGPGIEQRVLEQVEHAEGDAEEEALALLGTVSNEPVRRRTSMKQSSRRRSVGSGKTRLNKL